MIEGIRPDASRQLITVTGPVAPHQAAITDAHNHLWIEPVSGTEPGAPVLNNKRAIAQELRDYRQAGGRTIVDCQPAGCGRNGRILVELARASGVQIIVATGYHLKRYYPSGYWLFDASVEEARAIFVRELVDGIEETRAMDQPARAGFIKMACEKTVEKSPQAPMEAAALAASETGAAVEIHTEKGADAERIVTRMMRFGLAAEQMVLCHMDKRAEFALHRALAEQGVMLEYDTFYRSKYQPEKNVWPLLERMIAADLWRQVAIATDMAEARMWSRLGEGPGLTGLITQIKPRLERLGVQKEVIVGLVGHNIASRLARPDPLSAQT